MTKKVLISFVLALFLTLPSLALASGDGNHANPCSKKAHWGHKGDHHKVKLETMEMLKEVMIILKDLNHKPSAEDKKKLSKMIERLEGLQSSCKAKYEKKSKNPCSNDDSEDIGY